MMPLASVLSRASPFICATISTSPLSASTVTQVSSPSAEKRGANSAPSSRSTAPASEEDIASPRCAQQAQKPRLFVRLRTKDAGELGRHRRDAVLLHAAHRHAGVFGLDQQRHPARIE